MTRKTECTWPNCECPGQLPMCEDHEFQPQSTVESAPVSQGELLKHVTKPIPREDLGPDVDYSDDEQSSSGSPSSGAGEVCMHKVPFSQPCEECVNHFAAYVPFPASTSPQGAGEQWKPDCDIEAMRNALSKLESQVCRNPDLPEAYKTILRDGFKAVGNIELRLKTGAQGAVPGPQEQLDEIFARHKLRPFRDSLNAIAESVSWRIAKMEFGTINLMKDEIKRAFGLLCEKYFAALATPEPHSPPITSGYVQEVLPDDAEGPSCHVCGALMVRQSREKVLELIESLAGFGTDSKEFMAQLQSIQKEYPGWDCQSCGATTGCTPAEGPRKEVGYCFATFEEFGCTLVKGHRGQHEAHGSEPLVTWPSAEPAASTDERLAEIAERYTKAIESERQWHAGWPVPLSLADIPYLLRLVVELRQERDEAHKSATLKIIAKLKTWVGRVGHEDYYKAQAKLLELESRAEQAERERDRLAGPNPTP